MALTSPETAKNAALDILNKAIEEKRSLSEFERTRAVSLLDSLYKSKDESYDELAACFFSQIGDVDNLLKAVDSAIDPRNEHGFANLFFALANSFRYRDMYFYIKKYQIFIKDRSFLKACMEAAVFNADEDLYHKLLSYYSDIYQEDGDVDFSYNLTDISSFISRESATKNDLSKYFLDLLDYFSSNILGKLNEIVGGHFISHAVYTDEGYDFISISLVLFGDEVVTGDILDLEDEFLLGISGLDYPPEVKTKVAFNFEIDEVYGD